MSHGKLILASFLAGSSVSAAQTTSQNIADLMYGKPVHTRLRGVRIAFDGRDVVLVGTAHQSFKFAARFPAQVSVSPERRFLVHNFGNGSGQIYDFAVYRLPNGSRITMDGFKRRVLRTARSQRTCRAQLKQISFLVVGWESAHALRVKTEDWTRHPGCERLNRSWTVKID